MQTPILYLFILLTSCSAAPVASGNTPDSDTKSQRKANTTTLARIDSMGTTIRERINPPEGFVRSESAAHTFGAYLCDLPLKPAGTLVSYYNGDTKLNQGVYAAVVDLPIGTRDLHQCADAVMRLRAEYLWRAQRYEEIHFNFTNGFRVDYTEWMKGRRIVVNGNTTRWNNRAQPSNTYADFWKYLEQIFVYAGTASLEKELVSIELSEAKIGDVLIQGGFPGHAVIIVDEVVHPSTGEKRYLLAQSYMPAQEIQLLQNPTDTDLSPWYELNGESILTPEWTFSKDDLRRFAE